jgi:endonuclease/exonuclease/phosphatase family metal-dependent hydrolase
MLRAIALVFLFLCTACSSSSSPGAELQVMTFNIRYGTANDGDHAWQHRKQIVADLIAEADPDVLAIQEGLDFQLDDLAAALADYQKIGVHRGGGTKDEFSGLYVRNGIKIFESGTFWLSETPDVVASKSWDSSLPRTATFAKIDWDDEDVCIYGTHFDHRGEEARAMSSKLIREHAPDDMPVIVMGDFNSEPSDPPMLNFSLDLYESVVAGLLPASKLGTFNGFKDPTGGRRIDHIFIHNVDSDKWLKMQTAKIHDQQVNGLFPSDHFPVSASFRFE